MTAKISDLGVAKILNLTPARMSQMTKCPGTLSYMPPEALRERPSYDAKLDCFSVGVMMLHVLCGRWPYPSEPTRVDPNNRKKVIGLTEAERHEEYFQQVRGNHPLVELIRGCLDNDPPQRPDAVRILGRLRQVISQSHPSCGNKMELLNQTQTLRNEKLGLSEQLEQSQRELTQSRGRQEQLELTHSIDMDQVQCRVRELSTEVEGLRAVVRSKENVIQAKETTIQAKERAIEAKEIEKQQAIQGKERAIQEKNLDLAAKEKVIESQQQEIASRDALLAERDATIGKTRGQVKTLQGYLSTNQTVSSWLCVCCVCASVNVVYMHVIVCLCLCMCACLCVYVHVCTCVRMCVFVCMCVVYDYDVCCMCVGVACGY